MKPTLTLAALLFAMLVLPVLASAADSAAPATQCEARATTQPAKTLTLDLGNKVTMKLVLIPAGKFTMGSPTSEKDRDSDEGEQREVTLTKPFYMGVYPVTQEQYEGVMGRNPSYRKGPTNPVEDLYWEWAVTFCGKASEKSGQKIRLPTEAEWEYACRAGTKTRYFFGDDDKDLGDYAWFEDNCGMKTHPVGEKKANAWGLFDMSGNVWQWCSDRSLGKVTIMGPNERTEVVEERVAKGGSWFRGKAECRSASRRNFVAKVIYPEVGFRVVVDLK